MFDFILWGVFPYVAVILAVAGCFFRYFYDRYSYSSLSSQFLESRRLFWGSVPWHYGILLVLLGHLLAVFFPGVLSSLISKPARLYFLEVSGLALGFFALAGMATLILRRLSSPRLQTVTSALDWIVLFLLLLQVAAGVSTALFYRWGASWSLQTAVPWLWSIFRLQPQVQFLSPLPWLMKLHILNALLLVSLIPFTRLVHIFSLPFTYPWRPNQIVIWNIDMVDRLENRLRNEFSAGQSAVQAPAAGRDRGRRQL